MSHNPSRIQTTNTASESGPHPSGTYLAARTQRIVRLPNPILRTPTLEVDPRDPDVVALAESMVNTMRSSPACVGLAANQVGELVHMFCMDVTDHPKAKSCAGLVVLVNATLIEKSDDVTMREGCLSIPRLTGDVGRASEVTVVGFEPGTGRTLRITANAMEARCIQHELDHLDGFLFVDRVRAPSDIHLRKSYAEPKAKGTHHG